MARASSRSRLSPRHRLPNYQTEILHLTTHCSLHIEGTLIESQGKGQRFEVKADRVDVIGWVENPDSYPVSAKRHTMEHLRTVAHLRPRTNTFGAVARVRDCLSMAVHRYFHDHGFVWVHTPIITTSDAEGAARCFACRRSTWPIRPATSTGASTSRLTSSESRPA